MYHTRESSNVPIFNQYCWNIPSAYENFTHRGSKLFFHFLLTININFIEHFNHRRSLSLPLDGLKGVERGKRKEFSFFIHHGLFSCDSSGIPGTRSDRFRWQTLLQTRWKKKVYLFPDGNRESRSDISQFFLKRGTVSSREYGTLCDTSAALRNVARWVSMSCHANDYSPKTSTLRYSDDEREWEILWCLMIVVTIFFNFKKLLRWLIIKEVFFFDWLHVIEYFCWWKYIYIYIVYF